MSVFLASSVVSPGYRQIAIGDFETVDTPQWQSGEESLVSSSSGFLIGTIDDPDGDVEVEMRRGDVDVPDVRVVFEGVLSCPSGIVSATGPTDDRQETLLLPGRGDWSVRIAVRGRDRPDYVAVFFDQQEWVAALSS
ncbi:hypothetical protein [Streptomyces sp. NPDC020983]|uniref:hypothetical protein n=1 Tax=Streptomyces sp. NPDC020983 TaxID=3365106 RepID=UPI003789ABB9